MVSWRKRFLFFGILLASASLLALLLALKASVLLLSRLYPVSPLPPLPAAVRHDPQAQRRGGHLVHDVLGCPQCHGIDLRGGAALQRDDFGRVRPPSLRTERPPEALATVLRDGLDTGQRALWLMPSAAFAGLSHAERHDVVAYLLSIQEPGQAPPATDKALSTRGRVRLLLGRLHLWDTAAAQRRQPAPAMPPAGAAWGAHLLDVARCQRCHQGSGAAVAAVHSPLQRQLEGHVAAALAPASRAAFAAALQRRPAAPELAWHDYRRLSEAEITAMWQALQAPPGAAPM